MAGQCGDLCTEDLQDQRRSPSLALARRPTKLRGGESTEVLGGRGYGGGHFCNDQGRKTFQPEMLCA